MDSFFHTHSYLVENLPACAYRELMSRINWSHRLIGIKGARGVGKTTFLLQYAKMNFDVKDRSCLYINANNFYLQSIGLTEFAGDFQRRGGKVLLVDQVYKIQDWTSQLRECYERYPSLKIVFTGSPVIAAIEDDPDLNKIVCLYDLVGFSFREYLQIMTGVRLPKYTLQEVLTNHVNIARTILQEVNPREHFQAYLHHGFYPFFMDKRNFSETLLKKMNLTIEVDIMLINQQEIKYIPKIKQLYYLLSINGGSSMPNVSQLAHELGMSRATVMHFIKVLTDARLTCMLYDEKKASFPKKPSRILLDNPNQMYCFYPQNFDSHDVFETYFASSLSRNHQLQKGGKNMTSFIIDQEHEFKIVEHPTKLKKNYQEFYAVNQCDIGDGNQIPLWLIGFID